MILTCPNCSTRFLTDPTALGATGRTVRCGACGYSWFQEPMLANEPNREHPPLNLDDVITSPLDEDEADEGGRLWPRLFAWFLFVAVIVAILVGGYRYRDTIVGYWPPVAKVYDVLGVPVAAPSGYGLVVPMETIRYERRSEDGTAILVISGEIENRSEQPQAVGRMQMTLLDSDGKDLRTWIVTPDSRTLQPGRRMEFRTSIADPPSGARAVKVRFIGTE